MNEYIPSNIIDVESAAIADIIPSTPNEKQIRVTILIYFNSFWFMKKLIKIGSIYYRAKVPVYTPTAL